MKKKIKDGCDNNIKQHKAAAYWLCTVIVYSGSKKKKK